MGSSALQQMASRHYLSRWAVALIGCLLAAALPPVDAQPSLRSSFPGRRIGGATRGECSSRLIAHLVPADSVFASGSTRLLAVLQGPTANPQPAQLTFSPAVETPAATGSTLVLPASALGLWLFRQPPAKQPVRWESMYQCDQAPSQPSDDPLAFVSAASPPAISLLLTTNSSEFQALQSVLQQLQRSCGGTVSRELVATRFGLADVIKDDWPEQLPVRCLL